MSLPDWIIDLTSLETLRICKCDPNLTSLANGISCLRPLWELSIEDCPNLKTFPYIEELTSLETLVLLSQLHPNLTTLPDEISKLTSLRSLGITEFPNLTSLPDGMSGLSSLISFAIARCPNMTSLPVGMSCLTTLHSLSIGDCPNLTFPKIFYNFVKANKGFNDTITLCPRMPLAATSAAFSATAIMMSLIAPLIDNHSI
nr:leucine-rich repeat protein shoc-2 [Quercus suber]